MKEISVKSRARLIRQDWSGWNLSLFTDEQLVKVWKDWFLSPEGEAGDLQLFIDDLRQEYSTIPCPKIKESKQERERILWSVFKRTGLGADEPQFLYVGSFEECENWIQENAIYMVEEVFFYRKEILVF